MDTSEHKRRRHSPKVARTPKGRWRRGKVWTEYVRWSKQFDYQSASERPYRGPLNAAEAAEGIRLARENAKALVEEASLLLEHSHFARARALAILAIEEAAKDVWISCIGLSTDRGAIKGFWDALTIHILKTGEFQKLLGDRVGPDDYRGILRGGRTSALSTERAIDRIKQSSIYVGAVQESPRWRSPLTIGREDADVFVQFAQHLVNRNRTLFEDERLFSVLVEANRHWESGRGRGPDGRELDFADLYKAELRAVIQSGKVESTPALARFLGDG